MIHDAALKQVAHKLPKIGPRTHAMGDLFMAGVFLAAGLVFYRRNSKRAALGAALCGAATLAVSALTDYEDSGKKHIHYSNHGGIHTGLAGMAATMPALLDIADEGEARFFRAAAAVGSVVGIATDYQRRPRRLR